MELEVQGIYLKPVGGALTLIVSVANLGAGILTDDGRIMWCGETWVTDYTPPKRQGRYTREVSLPPSIRYCRLQSSAGESR